MEAALAYIQQYAEIHDWKRRAVRKASRRRKKKSQVLLTKPDH
jgi:hypothetical protein